MGVRPCSRRMDQVPAPLLRRPREQESRNHHNEGCDTLRLASQIRVAKAWPERVDDDGGFLGGGLLCDFGHGEDLEEFGDAVTRSVVALGDGHD